MSDISPISNSTTVGRVGGKTPSREVEASGPQRGRDSVEVSSRARLLAQMSSMPQVRIDLVQSVKAQVEAGTYETQQKLNAAIENLVEEEGLG